MFSIFFTISTLKKTKILSLNCQFLLTFNAYAIMKHTVIVFGANNRRPMSICFCYGFVLSTLLASLAFVLTQFYLYKHSVVLAERPCEKRIVGTYRLSDTKEVSIGQLSKLTHIVFASLQYQANGNIGFVGKDKANFEKNLERARPFRVKTMVTVEIGDYKMKNIQGLMADSNRRAIFINSMVSFIREYQLDGINLFWESPKTDLVKWFVTTLCKELRQELAKSEQATNRRDPYIISLSVQRQKTMVDLKEILKYVDFLNLETDNYYAAWHQTGWNELTGPPTPLYSGHYPNSKDNLDATLQYFSCLTGKPNQLNIGVTFSARFWKNVYPPIDPSKTLWMTAWSENGKVDGGYESWRDLEDKGWNITTASWNDESKTPYIYDPANRIYRTFENEQSFEEKVKYAIEKNIGGFTIWSINQDDDQETLLNVKHRQYRTQNELWLCFYYGFMWSTVLGSLAFVFTQIYLYKNDAPPERPCEKRIIGNYRLWETREVTVNQLSKLTHIIFASLFYEPNGSSIRFANNQQKENFEKFNEKAKPYKVKTMFTLEVGDFSDRTRNLMELMEDSSRRRSLINFIVSFVRVYHLDGFNLAWEPPKTREIQWFVTTLCKELRQELTKLKIATERRDPYILSIVAQRYKLMMDFDEILQYVDFLNIETDNYYASWVDSNWNELTGPPTPIYSGHVKNSRDNLDATMQYYSCLTGKPNQLNIMVAFTGRLWKNVIPPSDPSKTLWMTAKSSNGKVEGTATFLRDHDKNGTVLWNDESKTPYIWNSEQRTYEAFEDERSFKEKVKYAIEKTIGGFTIWSIHEDDDRESLLNVLAAGKLCSGRNNEDVNYNCE
ncbi:unnamed protein product [Caenorhabditis brenneri]